MDTEDQADHSAHHPHTEKRVAVTGIANRPVSDAQVRLELALFHSRSLATERGAMYASYLGERFVIMDLR